ncbi:expansin A7 [Rhynchospora pubera]|uniref:Expansin n=2 Tax=Rhynchospora pubera TaxID=906938 RepID=A0AAV8GML2_9POAL|nr:expansin A7 [Rhynchospora pubera]KAJ4804123.1 expansin A7 [Rhynchospora pubera]
MASFLHSHTLVAAVLALIMVTAEADFQASPWSPAHATFYGDSSGVSDDMGGACGYTNMYGIGFGTRTAALSTPLFNNGLGCGGCYEIRCYQSQYCIPGAPSVVVTGTNLCPPNWAEDSNNGGWCNPPNVHFDMAMPSWLTFGRYEGGIVPVMYRRVPCQRTGGVKFMFSGNTYWLLITLLNVAGPGDVSAVSVKGDNTNWIPMSQNWGVMWQAFSNLGGQGLSFQISASSSADTIICNNVADANWGIGMTYQAQNNFNIVPVDNSGGY